MWWSARSASWVEDGILGHDELEAGAIKLCLHAGVDVTDDAGGRILLDHSMTVAMGTARKD